MQIIITLFDHVQFHLRVRRRLRMLIAELQLIIASIYLISCTILCAQESDLKFKHLSIKDGLSHSKVNCIYQDSKGFLWIGTNEGLNQFDGYSFTVFQRDPDNPNSISANLIRTIFEDSTGLLWIGTEAGGVSVYDRRSNSFMHFTPDSTSEIVISDHDVNSIIEDSQGNIWLGTGSGIDLVDLENKRTINYLPFPQNPGQSEINEVNVIYKDRQGKLWVGTDGGGLLLFDYAKKSFALYRHNTHDVTSISDDDIESIYEDLQGNLWIGTYKGGLCLFDREMQNFTTFFPDETEIASWTIKAILEGEKEILWLGTRNGLYHFNKVNQHFTYYSHDPQNPYSLSQNNVEVMIKDVKGDYWLGTWGGINFLNTAITAFSHYRAGNRNNKYLNHSVVYAILEDRNGDLWYGTEEGGLNQLNRKTGTYTYHTYNPNSPNGISSNNIKELLEDRNGNIWIGTYQGGLNMLNRPTNRFIHYKHDPNDPNSLSNNDVRTLLEDSDGDLWIGTLGNGLDIFDKESNTFRHVSLDGEGFGYSYIQSLFEDKEGKIWVGAGESSVCRIDKKTWDCKHYHLPTHLSGVEVISIFEDQESNLWFGTVEGGLHCLDKDTEQFRVYTKKDGLPSNIINGILVDDHGNLWLSTTNGLCNFNPSSGISKNYYYENGLQSNQFSYNAYYKTRLGELFFGGINGVTAFHPDNIQTNLYIPPVIITDFRIFNKSVKVGDKSGILNHHISETKEIELSYKHSSFTFEFVALNYAISKQNQYAYKVEGFEDDWNYVGSRRYATYTNLDPGEYTFKVKAANNDGLWNEEGASIKLYIKPSFWQTLWFKILIVGLLLLLIKHVIDDQRRKKNILKTTALANQAQLKLLRYQLNPHFLFNAHNSIRSMIQIDKDRAWRMITELSEFFRYTLLNVDKVEDSLDEEIKAVNSYLHIEKIRFRDSLKVSFKIEKTARECVVPSLIIQPLIENAIKYGMQTSSMPLRVRVQVLYSEGVLSIDVSNTGHLLNTETEFSDDHTVHGTALENIKKRLNIEFNNQYTFTLYQERGWVHAKIRINYDKSKKEKRQTAIVEE